MTSLSAIMRSVFWLHDISGYLLTASKGFTVWSDPGFLSDTGPGGLPFEYAAAVESSHMQRGEFGTSNKSNSREGHQKKESHASKRVEEPCQRLAQTITSDQVWTAMPKHSVPTCLVDRGTLDLVRSRKMRDNASEFQGHPFPSVHSLLNPTLDTNITRCPVTSSIVNNIIPVTTVPTLPEQIAILYVMAAVIRWQIQPTEAHCDAMPTWLRPCAAQLAVPHAPWIDFMSWPLLRERMCRWPKYHAQHQLISSIFNESISINWPYRTEDIVLYFNGDGAVLNPVFDHHIKNIDNWTIGSRILTM